MIPGSCALKLFDIQTSCGKETGREPVLIARESPRPSLYRASPPRRVHRGKPRTPPPHPRFSNRTYPIKAPRELRVATSRGYITLLPLLFVDWAPLPMPLVPTAAGYPPKGSQKARACQFPKPAVSLFWGWGLGLRSIRTGSVSGPVREDHCLLRGSQMTSPR
ncbi:hypothetical protein LX36DRAFT_395122 [Colletotrichum falcatum]|nr:hypothetical protein LX36DRAFT_395122 [Colletotrichum falcatum]